MIAYALMIALAAAPRPGPDETPLSPELEERVLRVGKEIRCATCQGLSIADSPAPMARSQLGMLRELVQQGKSDDEIRAYFVARYGEWALLEPPATGMNWLAWLGPALFLAAGMVVIVRTTFRRGEAPRRSPPAVESAEAADVDSEYLARVQRELGS
jgi:cytochrome c-type biogenesis protein CcmH